MRWQFTKQVVEDVNRKFYDMHMLRKLLEFKISGTCLIYVLYSNLGMIVVTVVQCDEFTFHQRVN